VNVNCQLYTIEGVAAALIILLSAWLMLNTPAIYVPGDLHISEMQLEEVGADALSVLDTPREFPGESDLQRWVEEGDGEAFAANFSALINSMAGSDDRIGFNATLWGREGDTVRCRPFCTPRGVWTGRERMVRVCRFVHITDPQPRILRLEVMMWRA